MNIMYIVEAKISMRAEPFTLKNGELYKMG
jgi:hypothetical protein